MLNAVYFLRGVEREHNVVDDDDEVNPKFAFLISAVFCNRL